MRILNVGWGRGGFDPIVLSPDGSLLAAGHLYRVGLWDVRTGQQLVTARPGILGCPGGLAFTADSRFLAVGDALNCYFYELIRTPRRLRLIPRGRPPAPRASGFWSLFSPRQSPALSITFPEDETPLWALMRFLDGTPNLIVPINAGVGDASLRTYDLSRPGSEARVQSCTHHPIETLLHVHFDAGLLALSSAASMRVTVRKLSEEVNARAEEVCQFDVPTHVTTLRFNHSGSSLIGMSENRAHIWELDGPRERLCLESTDGEWSTLALSPEGDKLLLAVGSELRLFDVHTGALLERYDFRIGPITTVLFAPDGFTAMASGPEGKLVIWDLE